MKTLIKKTIIAGIIGSLPVLSYAQDTIKICMIYFEYDNEGAIVKENLVTEEEVDKENDEEILEWKRWQTDRDSIQSKALSSHLSVGTGTNAGLVKIFLPDYASYNQRTLSIYSLSGIQQFSITINDAISTIDISNLPPATYIATLYLDEQRETKKFRLRK